MEMKLNLKDAKKAAAQTRDPMRALHGWGVRSNHAYLGAFAALGLSLVLRLFSRRNEDGSRGTRLGALLGESAPVLLLVGLGLERRE